MPNEFNQGFRSFFGFLPPLFARLKENYQPVLQHKLKAALQPLNLVNREEFEIQTQVLKKAQEKLERLQAEIAKLESLSSHLQCNPKISEENNPP